MKKSIYSRAFETRVFTSSIDSLVNKDQNDGGSLLEGVLLSSSERFDHRHDAAPPRRRVSSSFVGWLLSSLP
jgi:hypothetical protein